MPLVSVGFKFKNVESLAGLGWKDLKYDLVPLLPCAGTPSIDQAAPGPAQPGLKAKFK